MGLKLLDEIAEFEEQGQKKEVKKLLFIIPTCKESNIEYKLTLDSLKTL